MSEKETILLQRERNALERERLAIEKLERVESENSSLKQRNSLNWNVLIPIVVGVIGATVSVLGTTYSQFQQAKIKAAEAGFARQLQGEIAQQELIKLAVGADEQRADKNMRFLAEANLIPKYKDGVKAALDSGLGLSTPITPRETTILAPSQVLPTRLKPRLRSARVFKGEEGVPVFEFERSDIGALNANLRLDDNQFSNDLQTVLINILRTMERDNVELGRLSSDDCKLELLTSEGNQIDLLSASDIGFAPEDQTDLCTAMQIMLLQGLDPQAFDFPRVD